MKLQQDKTLPMSYDKGSQHYQGGWITVLINARAQIPGFPPVDMIQIIFIELRNTKTRNEQCLTNQGERKGKLNKCLHVRSSVIDGKLLELVIL